MYEALPTFMVRAPLLPERAWRRARALEAEVRVRKGEAWLAENREGVAAYNAWVAEHGVLSPMFRKR